MSPIAALRRRGVAVEVLLSLGLTVATALVLLVIIVTRSAQEVYLARERTRLQLELSQITEPTVREHVLPGATVRDWTKLMFGVRDQDGFLLVGPEGETLGRGHPADDPRWIARAHARRTPATTEVEVERSGLFGRPVRLFGITSVTIDDVPFGLVVMRGLDEPPGGRRVELVGIYVVLFTAVPLAFGYVLLARSVVTPIQRLVSATDRMGAGDLSARVAEPERAANELLRLARSFNAMAARVEEDREVRARQLAELEAMNRELARAQADRVRAEKLATVGRLSAGVAHEIGNPLGAVQGFVELLLDSARPGGGARLSDDERFDLLQRIERETRRIRGIVEGLLRFARTPGGAGSVCDPDAVVAETLDLLEAQGAFRGAEVVTELGAGHTTVAMDAQSLQQVLVNLILNGLDSMASTGRLAVRTTECRIGGLPTGPNWPADGWSTVLAPSLGAVGGAGGQSPALREVEGVSICVADAGRGMSTEVLPRAFEPFFTTKDVGKGTGLGLAIVLGSVENVGGGIAVRTSGSGTEIEIWVPVASRLPAGGGERA